MENRNLYKVFKNAQYEPADSFSVQIWHNIQSKQANKSRDKFYLYTAIGVISFSGFVAMSLSIKGQFESSGFFEYVSLIFSDGSLVIAYWKEYLMSLANSVPIASLGALTFLLFSILVSAKKAIQQYKSKLLII